MNTAASERGWTNNGFGVKWIQFFDQATAHKCPNGEPRLLILDGHSSHVSYEFIKYAQEHNIEVLCLPPHSTAFLQPLDVAIFSPLSHHWSEVVLKQTGIGRAIRKQDFCRYEMTSEKLLLDVLTVPLHRLYATARIQAFIPALIRRGFEVTGIEPFDPSRVDLSKQAPAKISERGTLPIGPSDAVRAAAGSDEGSETATVLDEAAEALEIVPQTTEEARMQGVIGKLRDEFVSSAAREVLTHNRAAVLEESTQLRQNGKRRKIGKAQWLTGDEKVEALEQSRTEAEEKARAKKAKAKADEARREAKAAQEAEKARMKRLKQEDRERKRAEKEREKKRKQFEREMAREAKKLEEKSRKAERPAENERKNREKEAKGRARRHQSNKENVKNGPAAGKKRKHTGEDNWDVTRAKRSRNADPAPGMITRSRRQLRAPCRDLNGI